MNIPLPRRINIDLRHIKAGGAVDPPLAEIAGGGGTEVRLLLTAHILSGQPHRYIGPCLDLHKTEGAAVPCDQVDLPLPAAVAPQEDNTASAV